MNTFIIASASDQDGAVIAWHYGSGIRQTRFYLGNDAVDRMFVFSDNEFLLFEKYIA